MSLHVSLTLTLAKKQGLLEFRQPRSLPARLDLRHSDYTPNTDQAAMFPGLSVHLMALPFRITVVLGILRKFVVLSHAVLSMHIHKSRRLLKSLKLSHISCNSNLVKRQCEVYFQDGFLLAVEAVVVAVEARLDALVADRLETREPNRPGSGNKIMRKLAYREALLIGQHQGILKQIGLRHPFDSL